MESLSILDLSLIFFYFAILLIVGYVSSRKQKSEDYLIANRNLGTLSTMATVNASKSGSILMAFVAMTYIWGFSAIWYFIGAIFGVALFIPFAIKLKEQSKDKFYTLSDYFKKNFGKTPALFASAISIFLMFGLATINLIAGTKIFVLFSGWPFWICALIMALVTCTYLMLGGFKAVAKTDIIQYIAMIAILLVLVASMFNGSMIPSSEWNFFSTNLVTIIGFFIIGIVYPFASPDLWQRVYSSRGKKELKNGLIISLFFYALMAFSMALLALTVKVNFPGIDPDNALIYGFKNLLPSGLVGLSTVLLFAAIMSSLDTYIYTGASALVQDIFKYDKEDSVINIKKTLLIYTILGTVLAIVIQNLIIGAYIFVAFYSTLAIPVIGTWIHRKIKSKAINLSFIFGLISVIIYLSISLGSGEIKPIIAIIAIAASVIGLIAGSFIPDFKKEAFTEPT